MKLIILAFILFSEVCLAVEYSPWTYGANGPMSLQTLATGVCKAASDELSCNATTTDLTEGSNLYFTNARAQSAFTFLLPLLNSAGTVSINNFTGDSGAGGLAGAVPAPSINQGSTYKFLDASGSFRSPGIRRTPTEGTSTVSTWVARTSAAQNQWFGMAWAPELGLVCGIASSGTNRVQWSRDGITWTAASAANNVTWTKIAWSPELRLFAAVAFDGTTSTNLMTSPDCKTWTARTSTEANQWYDIKWASSLGKFLAVSITGTNRCMSSFDGITWTACSMAAAQQWYSVTWSPELNLFAAVSITGTNYASTSPDGITWTLRALTTGNTWYSVTWAPELGLFVTVGATGTNRAATSPDGITWTLRGIQAQAWRRVAWSPQLRMLVAVASGGQISTSPDGITWTARTAPEANQWYENIWVPELGKFIVSGITGTSRILNSKEVGSIIGSKLANYATPLSTAEQIIRRDQNSSFSANVANVASVLVNSAGASTNSIIIAHNGHIKTSQTTSPIAIVNANAGTGATCTRSNATDTAGKVQIITGALALATGPYCTLGFNMTYAVAPVCVLTAGSSTTSLNFYASSGLTTMDINFSVAPGASTTNDLNYTCLETQL